jgi:hypothetical protein
VRGADEQRCCCYKQRHLMEQLDYNLLFRRFVGLGMDDAFWSPTTFSKNRIGCWGRYCDGLLRGGVEQATLARLLQRAFHRRWDIARSMVEPEEFPSAR